MEHESYWKIVEKSMEPAAAERSILYLSEHLGKFLRKGERVLICFLEHKEGNVSYLMEQAVLRCGAVPVVWGPDRRWQALLRQAFVNKVSAIIGPPLIILGLSKLKKHQATPLYIRKVITAAYPCPDWMIDGIVNGLDCEAGGCYNLGESGVVAGFACGHSWGVHLRDMEYDVDIVGPDGTRLPDGALGEVVIYPKSDPSLRYATGENARISPKPCRCGSESPVLMDMRPGRTEDPDLLELGTHLQKWTSILDCRLRRGESGLEIEIVCFQGEKLPKLPSAAKLVIRPYDPKTDKPFWYEPALKIAEKIC